MKRQSVLRGSVWLMGSALLAKILGAVFRIPLTALLGGAGMGYYSCAYGLFLPVFALSVTGINTAAAALTAQLRARGEGASAERCLTLAMRRFGWGGLLAGGLLFAAAEPVCTHLLHNPQAVLAVRMFAPAVCLCCISAVLRGGFEGQQMMTPTALSQTAEGIGRVICGLGLTVLAMRHSKLLLRYAPAGTSPEALAAAAAILGVTLSTGIGVLTLLCIPRERVQGHPHTGDRQLVRSLRQILLPVAAASLVTNLTTLIDLAAGLRLLETAVLRHPPMQGLPETPAAQANFLYGAFSGMAVTVFNLVPSVTNNLGRGVLPAFAGCAAREDRIGMQQHAAEVMQRTAFLAVPAGLGIAALAEPVLTLLFAARRAEIAAAAPALTVLGAAVIPAALSYPLFSMMQAAGNAGETVTVMLWGAGVKLLCNLLLIPQMELRGMALATLLCYAVILMLAAVRFRRCTGAAVPFSGLFLRSGTAGAVCAWTARTVYLHICGLTSHTAAILTAVAAGGIVYFAAQALCKRMPALTGRRERAV